MRYFEFIVEKASELHYIAPNAYLEYEEAKRYDSLKHISISEWLAIINAGRPVRLSPSILARIGNSCATSVKAARDSFSDLQRVKRHRALSAISSGIVEYPIILKDGNDLDLLAGNTRLTAIVAKGETPMALVINAPQTR